MNAFVEELHARGLIYQNSPGIEAAFEAGSTMYLGYDPTGPDLHIGHLLGITFLKRALQYGQRVIVLVGGGTAMIGDPGGKDAERPILPREVIEENKSKLKEQFSRFFEFDDDRVRMVDNADWLEQVRLIDFLREAGKYMSINSMLDKDSVSSRITREEGISYAEFSYQLLQSYDFMELYKRYGCTVQVGGSDQWGNIIQGVELIRKRLGTQVYALSFPLIVNPKTGRKYGKTESGEGIWLNAEKTHPYALYQFLLNAEDEIAPLLMKFYSFKPVTEIEECIGRWSGAKHERLLQKELAHEVTALVHGEGAARQAAEVASLLFARRGAELTAENVEFIRTALPHARLSAGEPFNPAQALVATGLAASMGEARRLVQQNGITVEELHDAYLIRKGKKDYALVTRD
ncbi:MAG: tyrosine--tRNA ligase [Patescibacteria group bacterium]|nr:tyrosine--tRNA ligase [Patescibacteria group bacterium]